MPQSTKKIPTRFSRRTSSSLVVASTPKKGTKVARSRTKAAPSSSSSSQLLTFPVEILTEIFKLTFGYPLPPSTPSSPPTPHKDVQSLLLASITFRAVALPLVFRSVTIHRSRDWLTFFGPGEGIFVVGEKAEIRRKALKEICLVDASVPPLCFDKKARFSLTFKPEKQILEYLAPLDFSGIQIESLTILESNWRTTHLVSRLTEEDSEPILAQIVANVVDDVKVRAKVRREVARESGITPSEVEDYEVDDFIESTIRWSAENSQKRGLLPLVRSLRPRIIRLPLSQYSFLFDRDQVVTQSPIRIVAHPKEGSTGQYPDTMPLRQLQRAFPSGSFETSDEEQTRLQRGKHQQKKTEEDS